MSICQKVLYLGVCGRNGVSRVTGDTVLGDVFGYCMWKVYLVMFLKIVLW